MKGMTTLENIIVIFAYILWFYVGYKAGKKSKQ